MVIVGYQSVPSLCLNFLIVLFLGQTVKINNSNKNFIVCTNSFYQKKRFIIIFFFLSLKKLSKLLKIYIYIKSYFFIVEFVITTSQAREGVSCHRGGFTIKIWGKVTTGGIYIHFCNTGIIHGLFSIQILLIQMFWWKPHFFVICQIDGLLIHIYFIYNK